jgi:hypothetical protein
VHNRTGFHLPSNALMTAHKICRKMLAIIRNKQALLTEITRTLL